MKKIADLRVLDRTWARNGRQTVNIRTARLSIPLELWWLLGKPSQVVTRYEEADLCIVRPTGAIDDQPICGYVAPMGKRFNINLSPYHRVVLKRGVYRPKIETVESQVVLRCPGAVNEQLVV